MYRILVCFKIAEDYDELSIAQWEQLKERPITEHLRRMLGCFDEAALENGLLLAEICRGAGMEVEICGLTVQPGYCEHVMRRLFAVGIDKIRCVENSEEKLQELHFAPKWTAEILNDAIRKMETEQGAPFDLILCGQQASPGIFRVAGNFEYESSNCCYV